MKLSEMTASDVEQLPDTAILEVKQFTTYVDLFAAIDRAADIPDQNETVESLFVCELARTAGGLKGPATKAEIVAAVQRCGDLGLLVDNSEFLVTTLAGRRVVFGQFWQEMPERLRTEVSRIYGDCSAT